MGSSPSQRSSASRRLPLTTCTRTPGFAASEARRTSSSRSGAARLARWAELTTRTAWNLKPTGRGLMPRTPASIRAASGSGSQRLYGFRDILVLKVVKSLLDTGISLQQIRQAVVHLRERGSADLAQVTLMSDGASVYECTSPDEVIDLLQGGQGVFGIALGRVWHEVEGTLAELPAERAEDVPGHDELAGRRARKTG